MHTLNAKYLFIFSTSSTNMAYEKFLIFFLCPFVASMRIPGDTEVLDGFNIKSSPVVDPEDRYFEARSLVESGLFDAIRNKRSSKYVVLESRGLKSHFRRKDNLLNLPTDDHVEFKSYDKTNDFMQNMAYDQIHPPKQGAEVDNFNENFRYPRSVEPEHRSLEMTTHANEVPEKLPIAEKQTMDDYHPERRDQPMAMDRWTKSPFDYSKVHNEEDSLAEATSVNEGIKARTPRVNFITQQKNPKSESENDPDQKSSGTKPEIYRSQSSIKPIDDRYYRRDYEELPHYRESDPYSRRYDQ